MSLMNNIIGMVEHTNHEISREKKCKVMKVCYDCTRSVPDKMMAGKKNVKLTCSVSSTSTS